MDKLDFELFDDEGNSRQQLEMPEPVFEDDAYVTEECFGRRKEVDRARQNLQVDNSQNGNI